MEDVSNPAYWKRRIETCPSNERHMSIYRTTKQNWIDIENNHKHILEQIIKPNESIIDCACGWGRLLSLLPKDWKGEYVGIDISPDFIRQAKLEYPRYAHSCYVGDLRDDLSRYILPLPTTDTHCHSISPRKLDWAILISIKPMIIRNMGMDVWNSMYNNIKKVADNILYLEYQVEDYNPTKYVTTQP